MRRFDMIRPEHLQRHLISLPLRRFVLLVIPQEAIDAAPALQALQQQVAMRRVGAVQRQGFLNQRVRFAVKRLRITGRIQVRLGQAFQRRRA